MHVHGKQEILYASTEDNFAIRVFRLTISFTIMRLLVGRHGSGKRESMP